MPEKLDEGALAEGVGDGGVESEGGVRFGETADPGSLIVMLASPVDCNRVA